MTYSNILHIYHDKFHNTATISVCFSPPYYGAAPQKAFVLDLHNYDLFLYFRSIYETEQEAVNKLKTFSCGTFIREG